MMLTDIQTIYTIVYFVRLMYELKVEQKVIWDLRFVLIWHPAINRLDSYEDHNEALIRFFFLKIYVIV